MYTFDPADDAVATSPLPEPSAPDLEAVAAQPAPAEEPVVEPAVEAVVEAPEPSAASFFLQVGAYGSVESAQPQADRLSELGFQVTNREEDGLIKLLVGPFAAEELDSAQERLAAEGIENFVR